MNPIPSKPQSLPASAGGSRPSPAPRRRATAGTARKNQAAPPAPRESPDPDRAVREALMDCYNG
jgi:hypothetical protein